LRHFPRSVQIKQKITSGFPL